MIKYIKPILYAPAGNISKAKSALLFGADAIYIGNSRFSLRKSEEIEEEKLIDLIEYCHKNNKKVDITLNSFLNDSEIKQFDENLEKTILCKPDSIIIADPAVILLFENLKNKLKDKIDIKDFPSLTLSTQANTTNFYSIKFWNKQGVKRVVGARELSLSEIYNIKKQIIDDNLDVKIEVFVHGAMCVSISGRCLLSLYMTTKKLSKKGSESARNANKGECVHPCRFAYLIEKSRENEFFPIEEDGRYSYILSSKDLCLLKYVPLFIYAGVDAFKIEGRMKSSFYTASITYAYRLAIDKAYELFKDIELKEEKLIEFFNDPQLFLKDFPQWNDFANNLSIFTELASHRPYTTGFYFEMENPDYMAYEGKLIQNYLFIGESYSDFIDKLKTNETELKDNQFLFLAKNSFKLYEKDIFIFTTDGIKKVENYSIYNLEFSRVSSLQHSNFYIIEFTKNKYLQKSLNQIFFLFSQIT